MDKIIIDEDRFFRTLTRIAHEVIEKHQQIDNLVLVGIKRRGEELAALLCERILTLSGVKLPLMSLDISRYRDDVVRSEIPQVVAMSDIDIHNKSVILVDDVLFTGRTVRAALNALVDVGRAARIELVIFVDRGHRELPIRADYVGKNVPTARSEKIEVKTLKEDGYYAVVLKK